MAPTPKPPAQGTTGNRSTGKTGGTNTGTAGTTIPRPQKGAQGAEVVVGGTQAPAATGSGLSPKEIYDKRIKNRQRKALINNVAVQGAGFTASQRNRKVKVNVSLGCMPSIDVFTNSSYNKKIAGGKNKDWICSLESVWKYREKKYPIQNNEFRLFIEGAEVTHYVQGTISWTLESTGGMNTCRFVLNNTQDAFILTPDNLCAGISKKGWRLSTGGSVRLGPSRRLWRNTAVDETAKYLLYRTKYNEVMKDSQNIKVDTKTGMWLYPLGPYRCIIHKHDPVRLFIRLPNTTSASNRKLRKYGELWAPAFTGFVKDYSWDDSPVEGTRSLSVTCYDYRGLLGRMRVRVEALPQNDATEPHGTGIAGIVNSVVAKLAAAEQKRIKTTNVWNQFLEPAAKCGKFWEGYFKKYTAETWPTWTATAKTFGIVDPPKKDARGQNIPSSRPTAQLLRTATKNPYELMNLAPFNLKEQLIKLWKVGFKGYLHKGNCLTTSADSETFTINKNDTNALTCVRTAMQTLNAVLTPFAVRIVQTFGYAMLAITRMYQLRGIKFTFKVEGTADLPIITLTQLDSASVAAKRKTGSRVDNNVEKLSDLVYKYISLWNQMIKGEAGVAEDSGIKLPAYWDFYDTALTTAKAEAEAAAAIKTADARMKAANIPLGMASGRTALDRNKAPNAITYPTNAQKAIIKDATAAYAKKWALEPNVKVNLGHLSGYVGRLSNIENEIVEVLNNKNTPIAVAEEYGRAFKLIQKATTQSGTKPKFVRKYGYAKSEISGADVAAHAGNIGLSQDTATLSNEVQNAYINRTTVTKENHKKNIANKIAKYKKAVAEIKVHVSGLGYAQLMQMITYLSKQAEVKIEPPQRWPMFSQPGNGFNGKVATRPRGFPAINYQFKWRHDLIYKMVAKDTGFTRRGMAKLDKLVDIWAAFAKKSQSAQGARQETVKRTTDKYADFDRSQAGMFADLVEANKSLAHPLMGKSFEQAVVFLTTGGDSPLVTGAVYDLTSYSSGVLKEWNKVTVFGAVQRPITYQEVSAIGQGTNRNLDSMFSPLNAFVHFLRPSQGTGAATIVQQDTGSGSKSLTQAPTYETRKSLLDKSCQALDYQFYVSPMGDLVFEIPNYNAFPEDFGKAFQQAYEVNQEWISSTISEENSDVATAYKFTGQTFEKKLESATASTGIRNVGQFVYLWPILARRIGVQQQDIILQIPGVGDPAGMGAGYKEKAESQLRVYAAFFMQRQIGRMHTLMVRHPFRPYLLPNRPIWLIPRQRIGLPQSVSHSMSAPDGVCTTESQLIYVREMFRDGTFRFVGGGQRQPIDYAGFLSGDAAAMGKSGSGLIAGYGSLGTAGRFSRSQILNRLRRSSNFSTAMGATFGDYFKYKPVKTKTPPSPPPEKGKAVDLAAGGVVRNPPEKKAAKTVAANGRTKKTSDTYFGRFYSPWASGSDYGKKNHAFRSFGYLRSFNTEQYQKVAKQQNRSVGNNKRKDRWHNGIDILCPYKTLAKAPINLQRLYCVINCNLGGGELESMTQFVSTDLDKRISSFTSGSLKAKYAAHPAAVFFSSKKLEIFPSIGGYTYKGQIWSSAWKRWNELTFKGTRGSGSVLISRQYAVGIMLIGQGWIQPPNKQSDEEKLWAKLIWVHLDNLHGTPGSKYGADITKDIPKGTPIAEMNDRGSTGSPHLHFEVHVRPGKGETATQAQLDLFAAVRKAQKDYLQTQLVAMARGWKYEAGSIVDPNNLDGNASKYWQSWAKRLPVRKDSRGYTHRPKNTKKNPVTVREIVNFYKSLKKYRKAAARGGSAYHKAKKGRSVDYLVTNPAQWFKCSDLLIPNSSRNTKFKRIFLEACGGASSPTGGGASYRTGSPRGPVSSYTPPPLAWCNATMGRKKAGGDAKAAQARSKAKQQTATDPSKAKKAKKDLKANLAKATAVKKQIEANNIKAKNAKPGRTKADKNLQSLAKKRGKKSTTKMAVGSTGGITPNKVKR